MFPEIGNTHYQRFQDLIKAEEWFENCLLPKIKKLRGRLDSNPPSMRLRRFAKMACCSSIGRRAMIFSDRLKRRAIDKLKSHVFATWSSRCLYLLFLSFIRYIERDSSAKEYYCQPEYDVGFPLSTDE